MSDIHDDKLERILRSRQIEPAGPDLAERIVLRAQAIPQKQTMPLLPWLKRLFAELHIPRPAVVLASALILGFVAGYSAPLLAPADTGDGVSVQSFLYADEDIL
jgi:hypothetical protein